MSSRRPLYECVIDGRSNVSHAQRGCNQGFLRTFATERMLMFPLASFHLGRERDTNRRQFKKNILEEQDHKEVNPFQPSSSGMVELHIETYVARGSIPLHTGPGKICKFFRGDRISIEKGSWREPQPISLPLWQGHTSLLSYFLDAKSQATALLNPRFGLSNIGRDGISSEGNNTPRYLTPIRTPYEY